MENETEHSFDYAALIGATRAEIKVSTMIDNFLIFCINFYKLHISPHKGFRCAYAAYYNDFSCSTWALKTIEINGWLYFLLSIKNRANSCHSAKLALVHVKYKENNGKNDIAPSKDNSLRNYLKVADRCIGCFPCYF